MSEPQYTSNSVTAGTGLAVERHAGPDLALVVGRADYA